MNPASQSQPHSDAPCPYSDDLKALVDGELSFWEARRVRAHLRSCAGCQEEYQMIQTLTEELQKNETAAPLAPELRTQIMEAARQSVPTPAPAPEAPVEVARRPFRLAPAFALVPLVACAVVLMMTLTGGKIKNTFNRAADSISTDTGGGSVFSSPVSPVPQWDNGSSTSSRSEAVPNAAPPMPDAFRANTFERRVHKQGSLAVSVADVEASSDKVTRIVKSVGGFIATNSLSSDQGRTASLETRVPVDKFEEVVRAIGGLGQVRAKNISGQDVTDQYVTTEARRDALNRELAISQAKLNALQDKAKRGNLAERQQLQYQLLRMRAATAEARARFAAMHKLAALASLSVTLQEKKTVIAPATLGQDLNKTGREAWASLLATARVPLTVLIYILAYSPIWLPALFLWRRYAPPARK